MWLAVDEDKEEVIFDKKPIRGMNGFPFWSCEYEDGSVIYAPYGSIEKLIGRKLTWSDEPVEI